MADNSIVQTIKNAEVDARSLSEFISKDANFMVYRRLAPNVHTLDYYLSKLNVVSSDLEVRIKDIISTMGFVIKGTFEGGGTIDNYNEVLADSSGVLYRWGGVLPKSVAAGSTPQSSGGFADNAWVAISNADSTRIASGKAINGSGAVLVDGSTIYTESYQQLSVMPTDKIKSGQVAKVRGTDFVWDGTKWKPAGRIYVNSWGARGDAPKRLDETNATNSKQAFIEAALYAKSNGYNYVFAEAGIYHTPDLSSDDMQGVYIVGDDVFFTCRSNSSSQVGHAKVLALSEQEYKNGAAWASKNNSNTKGRISFVFDDGTWTQFAVLPHLFKKYGVTYGIAWHTGADNKDWIKEMYRHGFEILAHTPDNIDCTTLSNSELAQRANMDLDAIEAITGSRDNVHFVYPMHARNERTDSVLSQYFLTGRGVYSVFTKPDNQAGSWLCSSLSLEAVSKSNILKAVKHVADSNSNLVLYGHNYFFENQDHIEDIIKYALSLGVNIAPPSQVKSAPETHFKRGFADKAEWTLGTNTEWSETVKSEFSIRSVRAKSAASGHAPFNFETSAYHQARSSKNYSHYKLSFVYKSAAEIQTSPNYGVGVRYQYRGLDAGGLPSTGALSNTSSIKSLPAADFDKRVVFDVYIPNSVSEFRIGISSLNVVAPYDIYIDDFRFFKVGDTDQAVISAKVGDTLSSVVMGSKSLNVFSIVPDYGEIISNRVHMGHLTTDASVNVVKTTPPADETEASDVGKSVFVVATPKSVYAKYLDY